jgi:hypothetical protein
MGLDGMATPVRAAEGTGLQLPVERQCQADKGQLALFGSCPAGDAAIVGLRW